MARGGWLDSKAVFYEGHWANSGKGVRSRYLGLKFMIKGEMHYGWARFNVSFPHQTVCAVLTGYAYETIAHKAIVAGKTKGPDNVSVEESEATLTVPTRKPASLGMLAGGSNWTLHLAKREVSRRHTLAGARHASAGSCLLTQVESRQIISVSGGGLYETLGPPCSLNLRLFRIRS